MTIGWPSRRGVEFALALPLALGAGCASFDPELVLAPSALVAGEADGFRARALTSPLDARSALLRIEAPEQYSHAGRSFRGVPKVTVLDANWEPLREHTSTEQHVEVALSGEPGARILHLLIDRPAAPQQRVDLSVRIEEVPYSALPDEAIAERPALIRWSYPLWGLPRDLLDLPFTALGRAGFGRLAFLHEKTDRPSGAAATYAVAGLTGAIWGAVWGFHQSGHHFMKSGLYTYLGGFGGAALGVGVVGAVDVALAFVVRPLEVLLLRSGADDVYFKLEQPRVDHAGEWTAEALSRYDRFERSNAWFPNWRYLAHGRSLEAPGSAPDRFLRVAELEFVPAE